jgi:hypothetical protein
LREPEISAFTAALHTLLESQRAEHKKLKRAGHICPNVFWRMVADERGGREEAAPDSAV